MPNLPLQSEYERIVKNSERLFKSLEKSSKKEYALMLKELRAEVSDVYIRYANKEGVLTYAEMQKYNRIKNLKKAIDGIVQERTAAVKTQLTTTLKDDIQQSYTASMVALGDAAAVELPTRIPADTITAILQKPVEGWTVQERMALRTRDLAVRIQGAITNGFVRGDKVADAAAAVKDVAEKDFIRFRSFAGDINHKVSQDAIVESRLDAGKEADIMVVSTWVTAGDNRVRDAHRLLDGQTVRGDQKFVIPSGPWKGYSADGPQGFGEPALDYGCRCIQVADVVKRE